MYLNNKKIEELFEEFSGKFVGTTKVLTFERFKKAIQSITDKSNMLENPEYISLPDLRNELGIAAHVGCLIEMNISGDISDIDLLENLRECSKAFTESINKLSRKEN